MHDYKTGRNLAKQEKENKIYTTHI